jgi:clan AA aspartic protease
MNRFILAKEDHTGEIRSKVKLTNASDEGLFRRGQIGIADIRTYETDALIDTGAVRPVIPVHVQERLGLATRGHLVAEYADGRKETVAVSESMVIEIEGRNTVEEALVLGDEVLIGQTVLEKLDMLADCRGGKLVPNPAHPDQPVSKVK